MEVRIGIQNVSRELSVETNASAADVAKLVEAAAAGSIFTLDDIKGGTVLVPSHSLAYVEIGEESKRRVGFGG